MTHKCLQSACHLTQRQVTEGTIGGGEDSMWSLTISEMFQPGHIDQSLEEGMIRAGSDGFVDGHG